MKPTMRDLLTIGVTVASLALFGCDGSGSKKSSKVSGTTTSTSTGTGANASGSGGTLGGLPGGGTNTSSGSTGTGGTGTGGTGTGGTGTGGTGGLPGGGTGTGKARRQRAAAVCDGAAEGCAFAWGRGAGADRLFGLAPGRLQAWAVSEASATAAAGADVVAADLD